MTNITEYPKIKELLTLESSSEELKNEITDVLGKINAPQLLLHELIQEILDYLKLKNKYTENLIEGRKKINDSNGVSLYTGDLITFKIDQDIERILPYTSISRIPPPDYHWNYCSKKKATTQAEIINRSQQMNFFQAMRVFIGLIKEEYHFNEYDKKIILKETLENGLKFELRLKRTGKSICISLHDSMTPSMYNYDQTYLYASRFPQQDQ